MIQVVLKNGKYAIYNTKGGSIPPVVSSVTIPTNIVVNTPISVSYTIVGLPTTITRTWYRGVAVIATSTTSDLYTPVQADAGNASNIKCVITATNSGGAGTADSNTVAQVLTVRTSAFLTASAISDATIRGGLNTFDIGLISNSLDTKMKALYPFVSDGATSNDRALQHRWNFMDARDLNAAYRLQFTGGWTHSALGALPNGVNTLARTYLVPTTALNTNDHALFFYLNTNNPYVATDPLDMGSIEDVNRRLVLYSRLDVFGGTADAAAVSIPYVAPRACFALITKQSATVSSAFKNATKVVTAASGGTPPPLYDIIFGNCRISGTPYGIGWSTNRFAMVGISDGLSDADSVNLYNLTQTFQTTLGRQV